MYKGGVKVNQADISLTRFITAQTGDATPYNDYYEISGVYQIPITDIDGQGTDISDITSDTYEFRVTAQDRVASNTGITTSGVAVMTFGAGGTDVRVHKPMFMDGVLGSTHTQNQWDNSVDLLTIDQLYQGNAWRVDQYVDNYPANSPLGVARAVYYRQQFAYWTTSLDHAVLVLWEVFPVPSRIWVAAYDRNQGGWRSWKSITLS